MIGCSQVRTSVLTSATDGQIKNASWVQYLKKKTFLQKHNLRWKAWFQTTLLRQGEETHGQVALPRSNRGFLPLGWKTTMTSRGSELVVIPGEIKLRLFFIGREYMNLNVRFQVCYHSSSLPEMRRRVRTKGWCEVMGRRAQMARAEKIIICWFFKTNHEKGERGFLILYLIYTYINTYNT